MSAYFHSYLCGRKAAEWLIKMPEKPLVPYQSLKQKQKARIADWMYRETLRFFLEHQQMPEAEEFEVLCQTVYVKVCGSNYRVAYDEIQALYTKRLDSYAQRIQRDVEAGVTLESLATPPKQKKTQTPPRKRKKNKREPDATEFWQDDRFFFIAGYTSGGAPYGVTWEEMGLEPWEDLP